MDLDEAVDDHLPVQQVEPGMDHHRVPDRHLAGHHREPVGQARQHRHPAPLPGLRPVEGLGEEGVA